MIPWPIFLGLWLQFIFVAGSYESDKKLETVLMNGYNNKARPVRKEETIVKVSVFLNIAHIEKIDEMEQTMLVHGHIWASWTDEYLKWNKDEYNNTSKIQIQAWRIWQPAFALYNSARGNSWHLHMHGLPATVYSSGKVWASGTYSFYVTCQFDFTNWPFDTQKCPIVIADWVYGLAQVNLSDPDGMSEYLKPTIRLSYDPVVKNTKKHVGGWEVQDTWKKHCYWGARGCKDEPPEGELEWYWSLLEFGVVMKRHIPYFGATMFIPLLVTTTLILMAFWIETFQVSISATIFNILLQGLYGWEMISTMPPGSGSIPKIVQLYSLNLILSALTFAVLVLFKFVEDSMPKSYFLDFGFDISEIPKKLKIEKLFQKNGISFDPQQLLNPDLEQIDEMEGGESPGTSIGMSDAFGNDSRIDSFVISESTENQNDSETLIPINLPSAPAASSEQPNAIPEPRPSAPNTLHLQLYTIKRFLFLIYVLIYLLCIVFWFAF